MERVILCFRAWGRPDAFFLARCVDALVAQKTTLFKTTHFFFFFFSLFVFETVILLYGWPTVARFCRAKERSCAVQKNKQNQAPIKMAFFFTFCICKPFCDFFFLLIWVQFAYANITNEKKKTKKTEWRNKGGHRKRCRRLASLFGVPPTIWPKVFFFFSATPQLVFVWNFSKRTQDKTSLKKKKKIQGTKNMALPS